MDFNGNQTVQGPKDTFSTNCKLFKAAPLKSMDAELQQGNPEMHCATGNV